jgi:hypothetical protein
MVVRRTGLLIAVVMLSSVSGTAGAQAGAKPPVSCATRPAAGMSRFDTAKVAELIGSYDVVMVDTTSLRGGTRQHAGQMTLMLQDSVPKRRASMARRVQQKFVVGFYEAALPDSGEMWARMANRTSDAPGVFWSDGFLRIGEFGPKSGISLYIRTSTPGELRGMWTSHAGTAVIIDFTGEREPDEAGYFCARRK